MQSTVDSRVQCWVQMQPCYATYAKFEYCRPLKHCSSGGSRFFRDMHISGGLDRSGDVKKYSGVSGDGKLGRRQLNSQYSCLVFSMHKSGVQGFCAGGELWWNSSAGNGKLGSGNNVSCKFLGAVHRDFHLLEQCHAAG